jgi:hypothetical protein
MRVRRYHHGFVKEIGMNEVNWPEKYLPGTTDNFVSNEVIVASLTTAQVWPYPNDQSNVTD